MFIIIITIIISKLLPAIFSVMRYKFQVHTFVQEFMAKQDSAKKKGNYNV